MVLKLAVLLAETEKVLEREALEARISALHDLRWEICRILDDFIAREEQELLAQNNQDQNEC